ncbi:glycosyltransferase family 4 protein [Flavobacterium sp. DSR3-2]|uniref:glycosyltransferase family 4 protein n=1 Tax=Flavobacterium sp. DSR3-2 TaxID=2804634 RepID=UPI003CF38C75
MKTLLSHPTLNANAKAVVNGFLRQKSLHQLYTTVAVYPGQFLYLLSKIELFKDFRRRQLNALWQPFTKSRAFYELGRLLASKLKMNGLIAHEKGIFCIDQVYQEQDIWVAKNLKKAKGLEAVYAYEDGALATFRAAKELGILCVYDLPIGYWKSARLLLQAELDCNLAWASTLTGFKDSSEKLARKDKELALADVIFVASSFTKKTLQDYSGKLPEIKVIPYGFPDVIFDKTYLPLVDRKLKVLFIGGLSQRKGLSYLFKSIEGLEEQVSLTVIGRKAVDDCSALNEALRKHTWIPSLPHNEILECMQSHDVLVFPSLFEGFGLVITEAMSQGTPVITTERTAGPDLISASIDGWLVEAGSSAAIKKVIVEILEKPELLKQFGQAAQSKAKMRPWTAYGDELVRAVQLVNTNISRK